MLTEKDIENIEEYIRGNLNADFHADFQEKLINDSLYKEKYEELTALSEAIHEYEKHKHVFDQIKAKKIDTSSGMVVNFNKYFNRRNLSIAASVAILIGIGFYTNNTSNINIQEYGSPENAITDSLELDSLEIKQDSLPKLIQYFE